MEGATGQGNQAADPSKQDGSLAHPTDASATNPDWNGIQSDKKAKGKGETLYYRVKCKDNGVGMPHAKVMQRLIGLDVLKGRSRALYRCHVVGVVSVMFSLKAPTWGSQWCGSLLFHGVHSPQRFCVPAPPPVC